MSHLAKIIEVKKVLLEQGITCPKAQQALIESVFVKASISYIYRTGRFAPGNEETVDSDVKHQLNCWNAVSPINGQLIIHTIANIVRQHYNQGCSGGDWTPVTYCYPEGAEIDGPLSEAVASLMAILVNELCNKET